MIYEIITNNLTPGYVDTYESVQAQRAPIEQRYARLGGIWHTDSGPLNQSVQVWTYDDLTHRQAARTAFHKDPDLPKVPKSRTTIEEQWLEIMVPAPFMQPLGSRDYGTGNIYEMCIDRCRTRVLPEVLKRWEEAIPYREKYSPLVACWHPQFGHRNQLIHIWVYKSLDERSRVRAESAKDSHWPPHTDGLVVQQESKLLIPAFFSPLQ